jgi:hypothetical protein
MDIDLVERSDQSVVNRPRFGGKVLQLHKGQLRSSAGQIPVEMARYEQGTQSRAFLRNYKYPPVPR